MDFQVGCPPRNTTHVFQIRLPIVPRLTRLEVGKKMVNTPGDGPAAGNIGLIGHEYLEIPFGCSHGGIEPCCPAPDNSNIGLNLINVSRLQFSLLYDPWEMTGGSSRQTAPLIEHAYVWAILLFHKTARYPAVWRTLGRLALVAGLIVSARPWAAERHDLPGQDVLAAQEQIQQLAEPRPGEGPATVCISDDYWQGVRLFMAPTLYARREFVAKGGPFPSSCDLGIVRGGKVPGSTRLENRRSLRLRHAGAYSTNGADEGSSSGNCLRVFDRRR